MINHRHDCWVRLFSAVVKGDARSASHLSRVPRSGREERATDDESVARRRAPSSSVIQECRWSMLSFSRAHPGGRESSGKSAWNESRGRWYMCAPRARRSRVFLRHGLVSGGTLLPRRVTTSTARAHAPNLARAGRVECGGVVSDGRGVVFRRRFIRKNRLPLDPARARTLSGSRMGTSSPNRLSTSRRIESASVTSEWSRSPLTPYVCHAISKRTSRIDLPTALRFSARLRLRSAGAGTSAGKGDSGTRRIAIRFCRPPRGWHHPPLPPAEG